MNELGGRERKKEERMYLARLKENVRIKREEIELKKE